MSGLKQPATPSPNSGGWWEPSAWYCAEVTHILAGAGLVWILLLNAYRPWPVILLFLAAAGFKEYVIDVSPFEGDTYWGSTQDFFFYAVGALAGWIGWYFEPILWPGIVGVVLSVLSVLCIDVTQQHKGRSASDSRFNPFA